MTTNTPPPLNTGNINPPTPYVIPQKYPRVLLPIQKTYLNPKICCMGGQVDPGKTITYTSQYTEIDWGKVTHKLTMTFPICHECKELRDRIKGANTIGYVLGYIVGGSLAYGIYKVTGTPKNAWWWTLLILFVVMAVINVLANMQALRDVPKEKQAFYRRIAEDKGMRMTFDAKQGFVAVGFLSRDFATAFQHVNGGMATEV